MTIKEDIFGTPADTINLSFFHITAASTFSKICADTINGLDPQVCPVMNKNLTYFFYGRPAYRLGSIGNTDRNIDSRPVCFLFNSFNIGEPENKYPCDTGALMGGVYDPFMQGVSLADIDCSEIDNAENLIISRYFGDKENYFYGQEKSRIFPKIKSATAIKYYEMLSNKGKTKYDDRCRTIEITKNTIQHFDKSLAGIIMPDTLLDEKPVSEMVKKLRGDGTAVRLYRPQSQSNAARTVESFFPWAAEMQGL